MLLRIIMLCMALAACSAPLATGHQDKAVATAVTPVVTLMTTWLVPDQPPQVAQTSFRSSGECAAAKLAVIEEGKALSERLTQQNAAGKEAVLREMEANGCGFGCSPGPVELKRMAGQPLPSVEAVCLEGGTAPAAP